MNDIVKRDIISVLSNAIGILCVEDETDVADLKELSNHTIHNASIFQDESSISAAILIYSLSKLIERKREEVDCNVFLEMLKESKKLLEKEDEEGYNKTIKKIFDAVSRIDNQFKFYIIEVINHAQIKKGSKIYEHGISLARTAEMLGISQWELMSYVGKTTIGDMNDMKLSIDKRLKFTRGLFN